MKIEIYDDKKDSIIFEGIHEFLEGGIENDGKPSFHIDAHSQDFSKCYSVYFYCDNKEELEEIIEDLKKIISK